MQRDFKVGDHGEIDGLKWRVVEGKKNPVAGNEQDLRLEMLTSSGWRPVSMRLVFLFSHFFYQNEEALYPRWAGKRGGGYFKSALIEAMERIGWEAASLKLETEKYNKESKQGYFDVFEPFMRGSNDQL